MLLFYFIATSFLQAKFFIFIIIITPTTTTSLLMSIVFANGPDDRVSIPGRAMPKSLKKWYLIPPCLTLYIIR